MSKNFVLLITTARADLAADLCDRLESASVACFVERVDVVEAGRVVHGFRVFVPAASARVALRLLPVYGSQGERPAANA